MRHSQRGGQTGCRRAQQIKSMSTAMSLIVTLLVMSLVSQCLTAPQRRNWTPQAILYLKGAQGQRSVLARTTREDGGTLHLVTLNQGADGLGSSLMSSILLELLQRAVEEGGSKPDNYPNYQEQNFNYL